MKINPCIDRYMVLCLLLLGCLSACNENSPEEDALYCTPYLIATTKDGTNLWSVSRRCSKVGYYDVYFSSRGTQTSVKSGKSSRQEIVPNEN